MLNFSNQSDYTNIVDYRSQDEMDPPGKDAVTNGTGFPPPQLLPNKQPNEPNQLMKQQKIDAHLAIYDNPKISFNLANNNNNKIIDKQKLVFF